MSIKTMTRVWERSQAKGSILLLMLAIADYAHDDGAGAYPSIKTLAKKTRMSEQNVMRLVDAAEKIGELEIVRGRGRGIANQYTIKLTEEKPDNLSPFNTQEKVTIPEKKVTFSAEKVTSPLVQPVVQPLDTTGTGTPEKKNIFKLYEQNIGLLTPIMADELKDAEQEYPPDWIPEAFADAVKANVRKWNYVRAILNRWKTQGRGDKPTQPEQRMTYDEHGKLVPARA